MEYLNKKKIYNKFFVFLYVITKEDEKIIFSCIAYSTVGKNLSMGGKNINLLQEERRCGIL